jgi:hypothetical protein
VGLPGPAGPVGPPGEDGDKVRTVKLCVAEPGRLAGEREGGGFKQQLAHGWSSAERAALSHCSALKVAHGW